MGFYPSNRKYLKNKLKNEGSEVVSVTNQLKLLAPDGKRRLTDVLDYDGVVLLAKSFPNTRASRFVEWFTNSDETIDGKSKSKAYALFESNLIDNIEVGTVKGLQRCVDWSKINDRETFMKGIDYSYYYEQED